MALDDLLAARVDLSLRGILSQLVARGWRLDEAATGRRAAAEYLSEHPGRRGSRVSDIHEIAQDVRRSMHAGQRMQQGDDLPDARSIPRTASAERSSGERYRYVVVVTVDDPSQGGYVRIPLTISSGTPLTRTDLWMRAAADIGSGNYGDNYKGRAGAYGPPRLTDITIITVDRSH